MVCSKVVLSNLALLKMPKTMGYSKGFFSKLGHFEISHSRVCMCSLGPPEHFANKPWSVVRPFCQNLALLKMPKNHGLYNYSKGFFSKLGHFEISHSRVCMCSLGPPERFTSKPWSVVRLFCQTWLFLKCRKPWAIVRGFSRNWVILKFLIQGSVCVHWVLLNVSPANHGL